VRGPARAARPSTLRFSGQTPATLGPLSSSNLPVFGQPTIATIGGFGFEEDLRLDPSDPNRIYTSAPGTGGADTSWIWRSDDGGLTFRWVEAAAPLNGKVTPCAGGGDTELAVGPTGRLYFNDLSLANFSTAVSGDAGQSFVCSNTGVPDAGVDRQWYDTDGDPEAGGALYLTNDEVGNGSVVCGGAPAANNVLVIYRSPAASGAGAGVQFGPPNRITQPGSCDEGIMGADVVSPVATKTGKLAAGNPTTLSTAVRHVYVIHDDATLSRIAVARCFPVAFGAPVANVSDPSGVNCDDLGVANLGAPGTVKTGANFPSLAIDRAGNLYAVWSQAPVKAGKIRDSALMYSYSTDEGSHWSTPIRIPTGLWNNVYGVAAAGDDGRVDIAWYGTNAHVDTVDGGPDGCTNGGPDSVPGSWSLFLTQTLNGHAAAVSFTKRVRAGEHPVRRGSIQTVMGGQCGNDDSTGTTNRTLGDFFQLRIGSQGEAQLSYADSENYDGHIYGSHGMYVRQIGGAGVYAGSSPSGTFPRLGRSSDPSGDAVYAASGEVTASIPNLDIVSSRTSFPAAADCRPAGTACLRTTMTVANLSTTAPPAPDTDDDLVWLTQWLLPAAVGCASTAPSCANGGLNFMVYAESNGGGAIRCYYGQNALMQNAGGVITTYPAIAELAQPGQCATVAGPNGTITIDVPLADVSLDPGVAPFSSRIYSVTASTMTLPSQANSVPWSSGVGGVLFNLIDVAPAYDARP